MGERTRREEILVTVDDLVGSFLFYDRKEDETLGQGEIEEAVEEGEITVDEIVERFREGLTGKGGLPDGDEVSDG